MVDEARKNFTGLGKLSLGDWERGLLLAVIGAILTVLYDAFAGGIPSDWVTLQPMLWKAAGVGITAGIAYVLKNLGTGANGKLLTNKSEGGDVKKAITSVGSLLSIFVVLLCVPIIASAQASWPDRSGTVKPSLLQSAPVSDWQPGLNNLSGDIGLLFQADGKGGFAPGIGLDIVTYKEGLLTLRAQAFIEGTSVGGSESRNVLGASVMVNLIKLCGLVPGTSWIAKAVNPSLGAFVGYDFVSGKPTAGPMLSIINIQF